MRMLERTFIATLRSFPEIMGRGALVLAVSGGIDSMTLLHLCRRFRHRLPDRVYVATLNHGIRVDGKEDIQLVVRESLTAGFPLIVSQLEPSMHSSEDTLRRSRRDFLERVAVDVGADRIWTAHTADDVVETMIINLSRGAGLMGVSSLRVVDVPWGRPLLRVSREEILDYARRYAIHYREDSTNQELVFTRNKIRHVLLPLWSELVGRDVRKTLLQSWATNALFADFAEQEVKALLDDLTVEKSVSMLKLNRREFLRMALPSQAVALYFAVRVIGSRVSDHQHVFEAINCIRHARERDFGSFVLRVSRDVFTLEVNLRHGNRDA